MGLVTMLLPALCFGMAAYALAGWLTGQSIRLAERGGILAHPNHRSSHAQPTPRLGGIGLVGAVVVLLAVWGVLMTEIQRFQSFDEPETAEWLVLGAVLATVVMAFALGLWDDRGNPPALVKLAGQAVIAAIPAIVLPVRELHIPYAPVYHLPPAVGIAIAFAWVLLMMNVVNFMDGVNGLAGRFGNVFGIVLVLWGLNRPWCDEQVIHGAILLGACSGFLRWNYPQARTFLGDCGSQPLGALVAVLGLLVVNNDLHWVGNVQYRFDPFVPVLIVVSPFVFDVLVTLQRRMVMGKNVLQAHREHLYQRHLIATGENHVRTTEFVTGFLYASGIIALVYMRFSSPETPMWRTMLIMAAVVNLGLYDTLARRAEQSAVPRAPVPPPPVAPKMGTEQPPPPPANRDREEARRQAGALWERFRYELTVKVRELGIACTSIVAVLEREEVVRRVLGDGTARLELQPDRAKPLDDWGRDVPDWAEDYPPGEFQLIPHLTGVDLEGTLYLSLQYARRRGGEEPIVITHEQDVEKPLPILVGEEIPDDDWSR